MVTKYAAGGSSCIPVGVCCGGNAYPARTWQLTLFEKPVEPPGPLHQNWPANSLRGNHTTEDGQGTRVPTNNGQFLQSNLNQPAKVILRRCTSLPVLLNIWPDICPTPHNTIPPQIFRPSVWILALPDKVVV